MSSSLAVGRKEPFQMASGLTRDLVLNASDTWLDLAKAFGACVCAVDDGVNGQLQAAGFQCGVDDAVTGFHRLDRFSRFGDHFLYALGERLQESFHGGRVFLQDFG